MFRALTLRGGTAELLWGHRTAAVISAWKIRKHEGQWMLTAKVTRVDGFQVRRTPLHFSAPRAGGFWHWPIESLQLGTDRLSAKLGPPEQ